MFLELPTKFSSLRNIQIKNDSEGGNWCLRTNLHPVKTSGCKRKRFQNDFDKIKTTIVSLENGSILKNFPKLERIKNIRIIFLEWDKTEHAQQYFHLYGFRKGYQKTQMKRKKYT